MIPEEDQVLRMENVVKRFGTFTAIDHVSLSISRGEALGLVGPNGSGKTTAVNVISGLQTVTTGRIYLNGNSVEQLSAARRARLGINRTFQIPKPFRDLTVEENVQLAQHYTRRQGRPIIEILQLVELDAVAGVTPAGLTMAQQKRVDLARALAPAPEVLLVDEIAAGLNPREIAVAAKLLQIVKDWGTSLLIVEHIMPFLEQVVDRVIVLDAGRVIFGGALDEATHDPEVMRVFFGD